MFSNKVKTPNNLNQSEQAISPNRISPWRERFKYALGGIALGVIGAIGVMTISADKPVIKKDAIADTSGGDAGSDVGGDDPKKNANGNEKAAVDYDVRSCSLDDFHPDDILGQANKVLQERYKKAALDFIKRVGITNPKDIEKIMKTFSRGCTKYYRYIEESNEHIFDSPEGSLQECSEWVKFEGDYKIPEDLVPENFENKHDHLLTEEEREWKKMTKEGKADEILKKFDFDQLDLSDDLNGNEEATDTLKNNLKNVTDLVNSTQDHEKKAEIVCRFMESLFEYLNSFDEPHDAEEDEDDTEEYVPTRSDLLFSIFIDALAQTGGVDDYDDCGELYGDLLSDHNGDMDFF